MATGRGHDNGARAGLSVKKTSFPIRPGGACLTGSHPNNRNQWIGGYIRAKQIPATATFHELRGFYSRSKRLTRRQLIFSPSHQLSLFFAIKRLLSRTGTWGLRAGSRNIGVTCVNRRLPTISRYSRLIIFWYGGQGRPRTCYLCPSSGAARLRVRTLARVVFCRAAVIYRCNRRQNLIHYRFAPHVPGSCFPAPGTGACR